MARTVFIGGRVFDGRQYAGAADVLLDGDRVVAVGTLDREARAGAEVVDVAGGLVAPGFTDAHVHTVQGGLERTRCDLSELDDPGRLPRPHRGVRRRPPGPAVAARRRLGDGGVPRRHAHRRRPRGGGARPAGLPAQPRPPRRLGQPRRPGARRHRPHTPDPADGRIERDADGHPTGTLHEGAMALVARLVPPTTEQEYDAGLLAGQAHLHSLGVTGWQDAIVGAYAGMDDPGPAYRRAAERGRSPAGSSARCGGTASAASSSSPTSRRGGRRTPSAGSGPRA